MKLPCFPCAQNRQEILAELGGNDMKLCVGHFLRKLVYRALCRTEIRVVRRCEHKNLAIRALDSLEICNGFFKSFRERYLGRPAELTLGKRVVRTAALWVVGRSCSVYDL